MADDQPSPEAVLRPGARGGSRTAGDVPDALRRRYLTEPERGGIAFYVDRLVKQPAFRDRGGRLIAARADPTALRHMAEIAQHRGWETVVISGDPSFRREAWLAIRTAGLEAKGYRPSPREIQALDRRLEAKAGRPAAPKDTEKFKTPEQPADPDGRLRLAMIETVVRTRVADPLVQMRALDAAKARIAYWLDRGARFQPAPAKAGRDQGERPVGKERSRNR